MLSVLIMFIFVLKPLRYDVNLLFMNNKQKLGELAVSTFIYCFLSIEI